MKINYLTPERLAHFIAEAIKEDIGEGDHSALAAIPATTQSVAQLLVKDDCILAGVSLAETIFKQVDPDLEIDTFIADGQEASKGDIAFEVKGKAQSILSAERLVLNCMQRMSGIASLTASLQALIAHTPTKLLDTRKTTPNFRICEKWAVAIGGGTNHRYALYDMIMLKDNHVDFAGGIAAAIGATQAYLKKTGKKLKIEIETRNITEVQAVLDCGGVDIIMLDNMSTTMMKEAVALIDGRYITEASGGITSETLADVAACGVDFISVGALTHSAIAKDMSLKAKKFN